MKNDYEKFLEPGNTIIITDNGKFFLLSENRCLKFTGDYSHTFKASGWDRLGDLRGVSEIYHLGVSCNGLSFNTKGDQPLDGTPPVLVWEYKDPNEELMKKFLEALKKKDPDIMYQLDPEFLGTLIDTLVEDGIINTQQKEISEEFTIPDDAVLDIREWTEDLYDEFVKRVQFTTHYVYNPDFVTDKTQYGYLQFDLDYGEWCAIKSSGDVGVSVKDVFDYYGMSY